MNKFIASLLAKIKSQYTAEALEPIFVDPFTIWGDKKKIPSTKAMESYNGWVYACIRAIAEDIAAMELQCFKLGEDNEEVTEHDLLDLLSGGMGTGGLGMPDVQLSDDQKKSMMNWKEN